MNPFIRKDILQVYKISFVYMSTSQDDIEKFADTYIYQKHVQDEVVTKDEIVNLVQRYIEKSLAMKARLSFKSDDEIFALQPEFAKNYLPYDELVDKLNDKGIDFKKMPNQKEEDLVEMCKQYLLMSDSDIQKVCLENCISQMKDFGITKDMLANKIRDFIIDNVLIEGVTFSNPELDFSDIL